MQSVNISKLSSGGFKLVIDGRDPIYSSNCSYTSTVNGIMLYDKSSNELLEASYIPSFWTIATVTGFTTIEQVVIALDNLGLSNTLVTLGGVELEFKNDSGNPLPVSSVQLTNGTQKTQVVDSNGITIPPNGAVARLTGAITRAAETNSYLAGDMFGSVQTLANAALGNGGGGFIMDTKVETDITQLAGCVLRFWLYTITPTGMVADNAPFVNSFANADKRCACGYFDIIVDTLLAGSDCVIGKYQPNSEYVCDPASKDIFVAIQTLSAITTPKSAGVLKFAFNVVKCQ